MRQAFRPYVKVVHVPDTTRVIIDLTDSSGVKFDCNYIQVEAVSGAVTAGTSFLVVPIITASSTATAAADMLEINTMAGTASGIVGGAASKDTGSVVLSLAPSDKSNSIYLSHSAGATAYSITYGNVRVTNSFADNKLLTGD